MDYSKFAGLVLLITFSIFESSASKDNLSSVTGDKNVVAFRLYRRDSLHNPEEYTDGPIIPFQHLSPTLPIKIIIHGWRGKEEGVFLDTMRKAFLTFKDYNIITVDWSKAGSRTFFYPSARSKVPEIAYKVADFLDRLSQQKAVKLERIHVIGHSLGAHIAGIAGYLIKNGKIGRITGMDPAGPLFSETDIKSRLSPDSAMFVDVIHSSNNFIGYGGQLGHIDFYPNGQHMLQPGCGLDIAGFCSHRRSFFLYAESIANPRAFLAVPCEDWEHFLNKECNENAYIVMGEYTPTTARGVYYLATRTKSPFGTGQVWSS